ncbi:MAG TPA: hypothetical protein VJ843_03545 [Candidatus Saccharimonadales bacterium]|nr:hypothetical protein [Candidatus Saccharimonadales bacterium]
MHTLVTLAQAGSDSFHTMVGAIALAIVLCICGAAFWIHRKAGQATPKSIGLAVLGLAIMGVALVLMII